MKIIYKITAPAFFLFAILVIFVSFFSHKFIQDTLLKEEFSRILKTSQSALFSQEYQGGVATESVPEEASHLESSPVSSSTAPSLLTPENFEDPFSEANQVVFKRYIQEFKDSSITKVILCDRNFQIIASSDSDLIGQKSSDQAYVAPIFQGQPAYFLQNVNTASDKEHVSSDTHIDIFIPVILENQTYGALEIQLKIDTILLPVKDQLNNIVYVFILAGLFSFICIYLITSYFIIRPIYYLQKKASEIA